MKKWRGIRAFVIASVTLIISAMSQSCAVHEWPGPAKADFILDLKFNTALPPYGTISYNVSSGKFTVVSLAEEADGKAADFEGIERPDYPSYLKMRVVVKAWDAASDCSGMPLYEERFIIDNVAGDTELALKIAEGDYVFHVWADCVGPDDRLYYGVDDFKSVGYLGEYHGNIEARDAYCGSVEARVDRLSMTLEPERAIVDMGRPLARYQFVSNDLEEFTVRADAAMKSGDGTKGANLSDYKIAVYYPGFMPNKYNVFTSKPFDSASGVSYAAVPRQVSTNEAILAFDYVMVNGKDASIVVKLGVFTADGQLLSLTDNITVPVKRSRLTTIYGHFLTEYSNGGVVIDPSYDGDDYIVQL